jgi:mannose-1-phosphate guanylyltransferase
MITKGAKLSVLNTDTAIDKVALLLAGGDGTRLLDLTREVSGSPIPKQYCRLYNNTSLLEATLARTGLYTSRENMHIIINRDHVGLAMDQLQELPETNVFIQPANRDTGPGLIFSLMRLKITHPDATVAVFPTDHYVDNDPVFIGHTFRATRLITRMPDKIAILGIAPDRPETGYGYLLPDSPVRRCEKTFHVKAFIEKPSLSTAYEIMRLGGLWNTFVMVFKLSRMLDILERIVPDRFYAMKELALSPHKSAAVYQNIDSWNFSTRVLTRIPQHIIMLEIDDVAWSDWGTRESIERTYRALNQVPFWKILPDQPVHSRQESSGPASTSQFIS